MLRVRQTHCWFNDAFTIVYLYCLLLVHPAAYGMRTIGTCHFICHTVLSRWLSQRDVSSAAPRIVGQNNQKSIAAFALWEKKRGQYVVRDPGTFGILYSNFYLFYYITMQLITFLHFSIISLLLLYYLVLRVR